MKNLLLLSVFLGQFFMFNCMVDLEYETKNFVTFQLGVLRVMFHSDDGGYALCSGTVVHENFILTAAHCW